VPAQGENGRSLCRWVWPVFVAAAIVVPGRSVHAQALEPRSYANTPVGINFALLGYGYTQGDVAFDASSPIEDAKVHVHAGLLAYARSLDVWGLSGKVLAALPVAEVSGSAKVAGQGRDRQVFGLADPLLRVSVNVYGAPALSMADFPTYQQDVIVGSCAYIIGMHRAHDLPPAGMMRMVLAAVPGSTASHYEAALLKLSRARHWWEL